MKCGWSAIIGVGLSLVLLSLVMTPTYASDGGITIQMVAPEPELQTGAESTVDFNVNHLSRILTAHKVRITNRWEFDGGADRSTRVTYMVYSNGIYLGEIDSSYDVNSGRGAQDYGPIAVPFQTLRVGENTMTITISLNSMAPEPRTSLEYLEFIVDSTVVTDNYRLTAVLTVLLVSMGIVSRKVGGA
jgi:hypothetical protein